VITAAMSVVCLSC